MANKIGRNKKNCEKYKLSGRREENKAVKQKKHEARLTRFAKRKEEGKSYVWKKGHAEEKFKSGEAVNFDPVKGWIANYGSNRAKHTEVSRWRSVMGKMDYEIAQKVAEEKAEERKGRKKK